MRFSEIFIPTLREVPAEADAVSHVLMLRAGYVRQLGSGLYIYLPLALRVMERINCIIREEMKAIGAQEIVMPGFSHVNRLNSLRMSDATSMIVSYGPMINRSSPPE